MLQIDGLHRSINTLFGLLLILLIFKAGVCLCGQQCQYLDSFGKVQYRWCEANCCGNTHQSHCCLDKSVGQIIFGSLGGAVLLFAVVTGSIICCRHYNICGRKDTENDDGRLHSERYREHRPILAATPNYGGTVSSAVSIAITPPEPSEKSYRIISRPEPTFGSFQPASLKTAISSENTDTGNKITSLNNQSV